MLFVSLSSLDSIDFIPHTIDGVELRLDLFSHIDVKAIGQLIVRRSNVLLTWKDLFNEPLIERLLQLCPPFFDLPYEINPRFFEILSARYPKTKFILSDHQLNGSIPDLIDLEMKMRKQKAFFYKIAITPRSTNEALQALLFSKMRPDLSLICMGSLSSFTRPLGPVMNNPIDFAAISEEGKTAPGQLSVKELIEVYGYKRLNRQTDLYGLIGDPVDHSWGHLYHNHLFQKENINAVYVKMVVRPDEIKEFFSLARLIGFRGLSVTMPLKHALPQQGVFNTLLFKEDNLLSINTDGVAAIELIEKKMSLFSKQVVLLGAGGTAHAIALEAKKRGAIVSIYNRTFANAKKMGEMVGCFYGSLDQFPSDYDVLILCAPTFPVEREKIVPHRLCMDVTYGKSSSSFLKEAAARGCDIIEGKELFFAQADRQRRFWFSS
jgi:3-dehydroquinate dehydratase/shikimate dehydrogenase